MQELIEQYTGVNEDERLTRQFITQMEFDTTMHALKEYLAPEIKVIEQGAATGRYSLNFAKMGCDATAVELTGNPWALASALTKLERGQRGLMGILLGRLHMPPLLRSHPASSERIARLRELSEGYPPEREPLRLYINGVPVYINGL